MLAVRDLKALLLTMDDAALEQQLGPFVLVQRPWERDLAPIPKATVSLGPRKPAGAVQDFDSLWVATLPPSSEMDAFTVGRSADCDVVIDEESVSKRHARLDWLGDHAEVEDLRSSNGTLLNGRALNGRARLEDQDGLTFGSVQVLFVLTRSVRRRLAR